jgi:hypothetical protein
MGKHTKTLTQGIALVLRRHCAVVNEDCPMTSERRQDHGQPLERGFQLLQVCPGHCVNLSHFTARSDGSEI